ncbi:MAG: PAS domain S-box protein [Spartobacteria bacterium]
METVTTSFETAPLQDRAESSGWNGLTDRGGLALALAVFAGYYFGSKLGFALTFQPHSVSVLWPPNSILVAALLLSPPRIWWLILVAAFPAHCLAQIQSDVPPLMILCWFISNCSEALIGAGLARYLAGEKIRLTTLRNVSIFCVSVVFAGPFLSSFLDARFVSWNDWGQDSFWEVWRIRTTSNSLAAVVIAALIVAWGTSGMRAALRSARRSDYLEAGLLLVGLLVVSFAVLYKFDADVDRSLLYLFLPFLLWAAVRFRACGVCTAISLVAFLAIWSAVHGHGPFAGKAAEQNAFSIQLFLIVISLPLIFLAGMVEERAAAARELQESEERYRGVVEGQTEMVCRYLPDTTLTFVNEAYCRFFGRSRGELIGRRFIELIPPPARDGVLANVESLAGDRRTITHEHEVVLPDGETGWQQWVDRAIIGADGGVREMQGIGRDITKRVQAEKALREREARINLAAESAHLAFWSYNPASDRASMSEKGRILYGFQGDEPLSRRVLGSRVHADEQMIVKERFDHALRCEETFEIEHRITKPDGEVRWVIIRGRSLCDEAGRVSELIGVTIDLTAQKQATLQLQALRQQMAHLSRVAVMGEMAASLAHELNQPLAGIVSNAGAGQRFIDRGDVSLRDLRELLADIGADGRRAGDVVRGIRSMVRKSEAARRPVNLNELVLNVVHMVAPEALLQSIEVKTVLEPNLAAVEVDPIQLQQVLLNLLMNAFDAMRDTPVPQRKVIISTAREGESAVRTSVRDYGTGLAEETGDRIFEQFYTSKKEGLGMGLAIARSLVESYSGTIVAENADGHGAHFHFVLPSAQFTE